MESEEKKKEMSKTEIAEAKRIIEKIKYEKNRRKK